MPGPGAAPRVWVGGVGTAGVRALVRVAYSPYEHAAAADSGKTLASQGTEIEARADEPFYGRLRTQLTQ